MQTTSGPLPQEQKPFVPEPEPWSLAKAAQSARNLRNPRVQHRLAGKSGSLRWGAQALAEDAERRARGLRPPRTQQLQRRAGQRTRSRK